MKKKYYCCFFFLWLFNYCHSQKQKDPTDLKNSPFQVASYNIRYPSASDDSSGNSWQVRKGPMAEIILSNAFDLLGTQEGFVYQLEDLKKAMPDFEYVAASYGSSTVPHNCATFYRTSMFDVLEKGVFWLSETPDIPSIGWDANDYRICQWIKFKTRVSGRIFYFFNLHFYWRLQTAKQQSGPLLAKKIKEIAGKHPAICTGDFNSTEKSSQIQSIKQSLSDAYDCTTKTREGPEGTNLGGGQFQALPNDRIDYIFISKDFKVLSYKAINDVYNGNHHPSDHLPITSSLILK